MIQRYTMNFTQIKENCLYMMDLNKTKNFYDPLLALLVDFEGEDRYIFFG